MQDAMLAASIAAPKTTNEPAEPSDHERNITGTQIVQKCANLSRININVHVKASDLAGRVLSGNHGNQVQITRS